MYMCVHTFKSGPVNVVVMLSRGGGGTADRAGSSGPGAGWAGADALADDGLATGGCCKYVCRNEKMHRFERHAVRQKG